MSPPVDRIAGFFDSLTEEEKQIIPQELRDRFQSRVMPELWWIEALMTEE
jgi:hypothetical protein